jgi:hypothetical protein
MSHALLETQEGTESAVPVPRIKAAGTAAWFEKSTSHRQQIWFENESIEGF